MPKSIPHDAEPGTEFDPTDDLDPEVIVVSPRPGRLSPLFLPPLLVVLLGASFLAYRATASDWRGFSWDLITRYWPAPRRQAETPKTSNELALNAEPTSPKVEVTPEPLPEAKARPEPDATAAPKADEPAKAEPKADPLDDIRREAEKTKGRIAELGRLKEEEARKLDATAPERRQADRNRKWAFRGGAMNAEQFKARIEAENRKLLGQLARIDALQRQQMEGMMQHQRDFFKRWGMEDLGNMPGMPGGQFGMPGPGAGFPRGNLFMGVPRGGRDEVQEFRGPGGQHGFVIRRQGVFVNPFQIAPKPGEVVPPPEPPALPEGR